jgi:hypothetical protein
MESRSGFVPVRWPDPRNGPYIAQVRLGEVNGRIEIVELTVGTRNDTRRIDGTLLRHLRVADLATAAIARVDELDLIDPLNDPGLPLNASKMDAAWSAARDQAMQPHTDEQGRVRRSIRDAADHLAQVAAVYNHALRTPPHKPTKAVAETFGLTPGAAAKQVSRARKSGLLKATTPGKAAGPTKSRKRSKK